MERHYKSALNKIKLSEAQKDKAKNLFYEVNHERRKDYMRGKKIFKPIAAVAAGLAVVVTVNAAIPMLQNNQENHSGHGVVSDVKNVVTSVADNYFMVTAYAKELTKTGKVYSEDSHSFSGALCGTECGTEDHNYRGISFAFEFPIECKGKNIDTITYTIEEGAFQVNTAKGKSVVIEGEEVKERLNVPGELPGGIKEGEEECTQYKSFTVDYDNQKNEKTIIDVIDTSEVWSSEKMARYEKIGFDMLDSSIEKKKEAYDFLTGNLGITCTVKYKDGSTETKNIIVSNEIRKRSDATGEKIPADKDEKMVVKYFSIQ